MVVLALIGLGIGVISGLVGIGGGLLLVPILTYGLRFSQHEAQGTSLAVLVPPIGIFAALEYYRRGYVRLPVVAFIAVGFAVGAFLGALLAGKLSAQTLRYGFGLLLFFASMQMVFAPPGSRLQALLPTGLATIGVAALSWIEREWGIRSRLRRRLDLWLQQRARPSDIDDDVEYHI